MRALRLEGKLPRHHLEERHAERVDVGAAVDRRGVGLQAALLRARVLELAEEEAPRQAGLAISGGLRDAVRPDEPNKLLDLLLIGALIEARSCERFAVLAPHLPPKLGKFYAGLLASEARHFEHYIGFARSECDVGEAQITARLEQLKKIEASLIADPDPEFRFHSGTPQ